MNVKADEYVAVFGVLQEGATVAECNQKMDATVADFSADLKQLGISGDDMFAVQAGDMADILLASPAS